MDLAIVVRSFRRSFELRGRVINWDASHHWIVLRLLKTVIRSGGLAGYSRDADWCSHGPLGRSIRETLASGPQKSKAIAVVLGGFIAKIRTESAEAHR